MTTTTKTVTTNAAHKITSAYRRADANNYECTLFAFAPATGGDWGGGTLAWKASFDLGENLIPINDLSGIAVTQTTDGMFKCYIDTGTIPDNGTQIYAVLTGATSPVLSVGLCDNT